MDWSLLGIEATRDKNRIAAAYRERLVQVNPEDKPEQFKALRAAYEEAVRLAEQADETPVQDESPVGLWLERVRALYDDFAARIRPESWRELLADDVCMALDKRPMAEEALMGFLTENFYIPQSVWRLLDETFDLTERREELYEAYPRDFVDYAVFNGIRMPAGLPHELFVPGKNGRACDEYRRLYYQACGSGAEEAAALLAQMAALPESHPYGEALACRLEIENGQAEKGREGYRRLARAYPGDDALTMAWAVQCADRGDWEEAEGLARRVLARSPEHWQAKRTLAGCLENTGREEEAKELIYELMQAAGGDQRRLYPLNEAVQGLNEKLICRWEAQLQREPEDSGTAMKLGWCYLQNGRGEDALRMCERVGPDYEDPYDRHHLLASVYYDSKEFDKALEHLLAAECALRDKPGGERAGKRPGRMAELLQMEGSSLYMLGRPEEALDKYERAMELAPEDGAALTQTARLLYSMGRYDRAAALLEKLTDMMPDSYHGYALLAMDLYELGRDRDAFEAVNRALELENGDLSLYVLKMRVLLRNGAWEGVGAILEFLEQNGAAGDISVLWCRAQLTEFGQKDQAKALELYREIAGRLESGEDLPWAASVYYRMTVLLAEQLDAGKEAARAELLAVLDKGLSHNENDPDCMNYKAWLLKRCGRYDEALALYHKLEALPRRGLGVEQALAEIYYRNLSRDADKALHYYQMLLDNNETADLHFYAGTCRRYMGDWTGAERDYLRERELAPDDVDAYVGLSYVYEATGRYEEALENADRAVALTREWKGDQSRYSFRRIQILRRMGRPLEAAEAVEQVAERYGYKSARQLQFEIYCQFGLWDEARRHLDSWRTGGAGRKALAAARITLDILTGETDKARSALAGAGSRLNSGDYDRLRLTMADLDGDAGYQLEVWRRRAEERKDNTHELMNIAQVLFWYGSREEAGRYAGEAMEKLDEILASHLTDEILYRGRRSMVLAILGREEEARAELARLHTLPLCRGCAYGACKDADAFAAFVEEACGNYQRAMELYKAGCERWPDETDFISGRRRLQRKGF